MHTETQTQTTAMQVPETQVASIKLIIADDHPLFRAALKQILEASVTSSAEKLELLEADTIAAVHQLLDKHGDTDLVLLDLHMPGAQGFSGLANLRGCFPTIPIVMISGSDAAHVRQRAADLGASGFISKSADPELLGQAINALLEGEEWFPDLGADSPIDAEIAEIAERLATLTPHQFRVYTMITQGLLNKQIAYELNISEPTVKSHVTAILRKLKVRKRTEVIILANVLDVNEPGHSL